ncbi:MAG: FG-GAP-like repeat-containing protein [Candidatus Promineifilaceae bacterium]
MLSKRMVAVLGLLVIMAALIGSFFIYRSFSSGGRSNLEAGIVAEPVVFSAVQPNPMLASLTPAESGIQFMNQLSPENFFKYTYNGAGVAAGDYDGDGLTDLFLVNEQGPSKLYHNLGAMRFEDVTEQAGLANNTAAGGFSVGAFFGDIDNDGDLDLFLTNWKVSNRLFENNSDGTFTDITEKAGVSYSGGATTATFSDYDRDGDLDFFVATYRPTPIEFETGELQLQSVNGQLTIPPELQDRLVLLQQATGQNLLRELGERDLLYRNNGDGTFEEVGEESGIVGGYWGLSAVFSDVDNDDWPDLYVTNDLWSPDTFYHNNGNGTFSLIEPDMVQHTPWFSMGVDFADINNDGLTDYFIGDMVSRDHEKRMTQHGEMEMAPPPVGSAPQLMRNSLYLNNGDGTFSDIAWLADVAESEWTWTAKFADLDLDGFVDLFITNGMVRDLMDADSTEQAAVVGQQGLDALIAYVQQYPLLNTADLIFRNNGDLSFDEVSAVWGLNEPSVGHGATLSDLDNDGDLDIVINNLNQQAGIYRNDSANPRITIKLQGQASNSYGLGAEITLVTDTGTQVRQMTSSGGYLSSHQPIAVFGLGQSTEIRQLTVEWPSGQIQTFPDEQSGPLTFNQAYVITEPAGKGTIQPAGSQTANAAQFTEVSAQAGLTTPHVEDSFDDFGVQMLLPRRVSTLGPGLAWGDVNLDTLPDLYIAGAAGQTGTLYRNNGDNTFSDVTAQTLAWQPQNEEMAPLWWNNGQNSQPSLLLSYSSVEGTTAVGGQYSSDQTAPFNLRQDSWQDSSPSSSGAMAAADYDKDGDLDLFVGGRVIPGQWPLPASSRLYRNDNGQLVNVTDTVAPELNNLGMATGAVWADIDGDNDSDLLIATEFGPVHLFRNDGGILVKATAESGLAQWSGLWTGIVTGDFDEDGDLDIAAGNLGLNTKYTASPDMPTVVYAGDLDGDGKVNIVEAYYIGDTLYPMVYMGMSGMDMPFIMDEFDSYKAYGDATLAEIYGSRLDAAQRFEATTLAHTLFINDGAGHFGATPLPQLSQVAPAYGLVTADLDNDGHDDLYMVGNFRGADHETMAYDGGTSYWLRGQGNGTFTVVPAENSGLSVPYEARGLGVADFDGNGWVDIAVAVNNSHPLLFRNNGNTLNNFIRVTLSGPPANPTGVGAKVMVTRSDGSTTTREVQAGSGYLSQDSATLVFGLGTNASATITVLWPNGVTSTQNINASQTVVLQQ